MQHDSSSSSGGFTRKLVRLNEAIDSKFFWVALGCIAVGILGRAWFSGLVGFLPWFLVVMTFGSAINCRMEDFKEILRNPGYFLATFALSYAVMPVIGYGIGRLFYSRDPLLPAGHVLLAILPGAITSSVWTSISGGSVPLAITLMASTTFLSTLAIPGIMGLVLGRVVPFDAGHLMGTLVKVVAIPSVLGVFANHRYGEALPRIKPYISLAVKLSIVLVLITNAAANLKYFNALGGRLFIVGLAVLLQVLLAYGLAYIFFKRFLGAGRPEVLAGCFGNGMRNDGAGIAIALAYFPPPVAIPSAVCILFQQALASLVCQVVVRSHQDRAYNGALNEARAVVRRGHVREFSRERRVP